MSKLINGDYSFAYPNFLGNQKLSSDMILDAGTTKTLEQTLTSLESNSSSLTGDIVIGSTFSNNIVVNSGQTTYNNATIIKIKDNTSPAFKLQCNDAASTDLIVINSINGNEGIYMPFKTVELGNAVASNIQIGDGSNVGATNLFGVVCLKNPTDSTSYTSTNCTNTPGGLSVYKNLNIGSSLGVASSSVFGGNMSVGGNITNTITTASSSTTTGAIITAGGVGIGGNLNTFGNIVAGGTISSNSFIGGTYNGSGSISAGQIFTSIGISLPTIDGTTAILNYYESNFTFPMMFQSAGSGGTTTTVNLIISRIGNIVNIIMPIVNINSNGAYVKTNNAYFLPTRFRPSAVYIDYCMHSVNIATYIETGMINVCATGCINICKSSSAVNFGVGNGSGTANVFHMVYSV